METHAHGFTIIEVMMFLAISMLLLLGVFLMSGNMISGTRFTDSVRGLESFLQRQYEEVTSGVNTRTQVSCSGSVVSSGSSTPGTSDCLLLGKVIVFRANTETVDTYNIVGSQWTAIPTNPTLSQLLYSYNPQSVPTSRSSFTIPWQAEFTAGRRADAQAVNAIAFMRSPVSSEVGTFHFATSASPTSVINYSSMTVSGSFGTTASYCIDSQDGVAGQRRAAIAFGRGQGSTNIQALFDFASGAPC